MGKKRRREVAAAEHEDRTLRDLVAGIRDLAAGRDVMLAEAVDRLADTCDRLATQLDADRRERAALLDVIARMSDALAARPAAAIEAAVDDRPRVLGGRIDPSLVQHHDLPVDDEMPEPTAAPSRWHRLEPVPTAGPAEGVEVRCRFGNRWANGFEVEEVILGDDGARYRLRRKHDGHVLPVLFHEDDVRDATAPVADGPWVTSESSSMPTSLT